MARVAYVEPEQASAEVKEVYEKKLGGKPGNFQKAIAQPPDILKTFLRRSGQGLRQMTGRQ